MNIFLLDTNLFQSATKSQNNQIIRTVVDQLENVHQIPFSSEGSTLLRLTPFGILEALGIIPPLPPAFSYKMDGMTPKEIYERLIAFARAYYSGLPELKKDYLLIKDAERKRVNFPETASLYEACVTDPIHKIEDINGAMVSFLSHDYFFKYQFRQDVFKKCCRFSVRYFSQIYPLRHPSVVIDLVSK